MVHSPLSARPVVSVMGWSAIANAGGGLLSATWYHRGLGGAHYSPPPPWTPHPPCKRSGHSSGPAAHQKLSLAPSTTASSDRTLSSAPFWRVSKLSTTGAWLGGGWLDPPPPPLQGALRGGEYGKKIRWVGNQPRKTVWSFFFLCSVFYLLYFYFLSFGTQTTGPQRPDPPPPTHSIVIAHASFRHPSLTISSGCSPQGQAAS